MRLILNDFTSPDEEIFNAISDYAKSYFRAMQALYKNEFLFGGTDAALSESNMKSLPTTLTFYTVSLPMWCCTTQ